MGAHDALRVQGSARFRFADRRADRLHPPPTRVRAAPGKGEHKAAPYLAVHPFGKVPALQADDGTAVFESGAILMYLADCYGGLDTPEKRAAASAWVVFANATFWPAVSGANRGAALPPLCAAIEALLAKQAFLAGPTFGVADVAVGAYMFYATAFFRDVSFKARVWARPHAREGLRSLAGCWHALTPVTHVYSFARARAAGVPEHRQVQGCA